MTAAVDTGPDLSSIGRMKLEASLRELEHKLALVEEDRDHYFANLTATQKRCSALLHSSRLEKHFEERPADAEAFIALAWALERARNKHPRGAQGIGSLTSEVGEVATAILRETPERVREECIDTAVVAVRLWLGEEDKGGHLIRGWKCPSCQTFNGEECGPREQCRSCGATTSGEVKP